MSGVRQFEKSPRKINAFFMLSQLFVCTYDQTQLSTCVRAASEGGEANTHLQLFSPTWLTHFLLSESLPLFTLCNISRIWLLCGKLSAPSVPSEAWLACGAIHWAVSSRQKAVNNVGEERQEDAMCDMESWEEKDPSLSLSLGLPNSASSAFPL